MTRLNLTLTLYCTVGKFFDILQAQMDIDSLQEKTLDELTAILSTYKNLHNKTDIDTAQRAVRAIEIAEYTFSHPVEVSETVNLNSLIIGVDIDRETRRKRISERLRSRLDEGMIEEVQTILNEGVKPDDLIYYGLEYNQGFHFIGRITYCV